MKRIIIGLLALAIIGCGESKEKVADLEARNYELVREVIKLKKIVSDVEIELERAEEYANASMNGFMLGDYRGGMDYLGFTIERINRARQDLP